jgi:hypothetical protein
MRQRHVAGERMFVDYSGTKMTVIDPATGAAHPAEIFIAVMGASNMTYVEASWTQTLPDWIGAHTRAFAAFGAVPALVVSDNLKSGVIRACFYEPAVNRSYAEMAAHYGTAILPARPYKPRDKAKVEVAVLLVQRWIVARLRNRQFFSLEELNTAIREEIAQLNARVSRHLGASRQELFATLDRPAMQPLPPEPFVHADWRKATVGLDYHVRLEGHHYSVSHALLRQQLWARLTATPVEIFRGGKRVACHRRAAPGDAGATTLNDHMPAAIVALPSSLRRCCASEQPASDPPPRSSSTSSSATGRTPSRASAPVSASCGWRAATATSGSRPPATGRSQSTPAR